MPPMMLVGWLSLSFSTDSTTLSSVDVVSRPRKADQSFAHMPAPTTSEPRFTVPATSGTCIRLESSSRSSIVVCGCTMPPRLVNLAYDPTNTCPAMVCRKTSTPSTSAMISSVSRSMSGCISAT